MKKYYEELNSIKNQVIDIIKENKKTKSDKNLINDWGVDILARLQELRTIYSNECKGLNKEIKTWYLTNYPDDKLGVELNWDITFEFIYNSMYNKIPDFDLYKTIGVYDSVVRERIFGELAILYNVEYEEIYKLYVNL